MRAVLLEANGLLTVGQIPTPLPAAEQVLIRMAASPINPSDLGFLKGYYSSQKSFPIVPGFEGSGTVIAAGSGLLPRLWLGKRVACAVSTSGGAWAEYLMTRAAQCVPLRHDLSLEQGATLIINPMTALAFFDIAKRHKHAAVVSNAAASALGRMILRLGQTYHVPVIHIVRREEQVQLLRSIGGNYILNSSELGFYDHLHTLSSQLRATLILDPVAGKETRRLLDATPGGSTLLSYGTLSGSRNDVTSQPPRDDGKRIEGFFLPDWLAQKNSLQVFTDMQRVQHLATRELGTTIQKRFPLSAVEEAIKTYQANPTAGKVLLSADS
jgi:NADPH:quinone reductase-like Zn-dependent oxidoreductase